MGSLSWYGLPTTDIDAAHEIGSARLRRELSATRVGRADDGSTGPLVYQAQLPLLFGFRDINVDYLQAKDSGGPDKMTHMWWRLEFKSSINDQHDPRADRIRANDDLVIAKHPYASGWTCCCRFKPPNKKGNAERDKLLERPVRGPQDLVDSLEQSRYDFWETGNSLTAAVSSPDGPLFDKTRNLDSNGLLVAGVCADFKAYENELLNKNEDVDKLLKWTEKNEVYFRYCKTGRTGRGYLHQEVIDARFSLMACAIRQALAGPLDDECGRWLGRRVSDRIDQIYRGHLNNFDRSCVSKIQREQELLNTLEQFVKKTARHSV